jgi:hypothetical protein
LVVVALAVVPITTAASHRALLQNRTPFGMHDVSPCAVVLRSRSLVMFTSTRQVAGLGARAVPVVNVVQIIPQAPGSVKSCG